MIPSALKISLVAIVVGILACNNVANHPVFSKLSPTSKEYRDQLANEIKANSDELTYTLNNYKQVNGREFLNIHVEGDDFEANGLVMVNNWNKLEDIKRTKGLGYSGAELQGLKVEVQPTDSGAALVYSDLKKIID